MFGFHPASQFPRGHCSFTLLHPNPFKQWHVFLHPLPKAPLSQAVIRKHMKNENEICVNENKNCSQSAQNNTISVDSEYIENNKCPHKWWPLTLSNIIRFEVVVCVLDRSPSLFKPHFYNWCTYPNCQYFDKSLNINNMYPCILGYIWLALAMYVLFHFNVLYLIPIFLWCLLYRK